MPEYVYKAVNKNGLVVKNRVEDSSKQTLIKRLKNNNLLPIDIIQVAYGGNKKNRTAKKHMTDIDDIMRTANSSNILQGRVKSKFTVQERINIALSRSEKITNRDLIIFTQNFYLLKKANFNNIHALQTIADSTENLSLKGIIQDILAGVEAGEYMYTTMEYYSNVFPYIYINMVKVGELSGNLTKAFEQAIKYLESTDDIKSRVRKIVIPNIVQFVLLIILLVVATHYAIPAIEGLYKAVGTTATLPAATVAFQKFVYWFESIWYIPVGILLAIIAGIFYYVNTPKGKYNFHYFKYTMPIFGKLIFSIDFSRFLKSMLLNLENGMRIQDSLEVSKSVVENFVMLSMIETSINNILMGNSWIEPFEKSGLASPMIIEMLKIGMQTDLTEMLRKLLEFMDMDINHTLEKIMKVLPEITYSFVGAVLIFFTIVILVPCIEVYMGNFMLTAAGIS